MIGMADVMDEAKEALIRERGTHLDSLMEKAYDPRIKPMIEQMLVGGEIDRDVQKEDLRYAIELGLFVDNGGTIIPANPIYRETIGRYLTRGTQDFILSKTKKNVWVIFRRSPEMLMRISKRIRSSSFT